MFTSFHFPDSGFYLLNGFDFYFDIFWMAWHWKPAIDVIVNAAKKKDSFVCRSKEREPDIKHKCRGIIDQYLDRGEPLSIWDPDPFYDKKIPKTHTLFITTPSILVPCLGQRTKCTPLCFKAILIGITPLEHSNAHYMPSRPLPPPKKKKIA